LKKIKVVSADSIAIRPFVLTTVSQDEVWDATMKKISKKELKDLAEQLGLEYDDRHIVFAKKLLNAYLIGKK